MTLDQIMKFCGLTDPREYLRHPYREGDFIVASNGHIAVRAPISEAFASIGPCTDKKLTVSFSDVIEKAKAAGGDMLPIPELPGAVACRSCGGTGKAWRCTSCDGDGTFDHENHDYECKPCDGSGQVHEQVGYDGEEEPCEKCRGTGEARGHPVTVGNAHYQRQYLALIASLGNAMIAPNGDGIAYFTADGCDGAIMPTRA